MSIDLERVRKYNQKCNEYKAKLSDIMAERKIISGNLDNMCKQLSQMLGREVTPDNLEEVYQAESVKVMNTLEAGESILNRIERSEQTMGVAEADTSGPVNNGNPNVAMGNPMGATMGNPAGAAGNPVGATGNPNVAMGNPVGNPAGGTTPNGFAQSGYKLPSGFGGNAFASQSAFKGSVSDFASQGDDDDDVTGIGAFL